MKLVLSVLALCAVLPQWSPSVSKGGTRPVVHESLQHRIKLRCSSSAFHVAGWLRNPT